MDELKTKENLAELLSRDNEDQLPADVVVYETYRTRADLKGSDPRTKAENVITVSFGEKAGVEFTPKETSGPASKDENTPGVPGKDAAPSRRQRRSLAMLIAGIAAALAIVALGVWYFRRK